MFDDTNLEPCTFKGKKRKVKPMKRDSKRGNLPLRRLGGFGDFSVFGICIGYPKHISISFFAKISY
jgi:hypothetical protein